MLARAIGYTQGGGTTGLALESTWTGNVRWARNLVSTSGDIRTNDIELLRNIRGAAAAVQFDMTDDAALAGAVWRAERLLHGQQERHGGEEYDPYQEPMLHPRIWFDSTFAVSAAQRAAAVQTLVQPTVAAGMLSAGYLEVAAHGLALLDSHGTARYYPYTTAQYSVTVRDPQGTGSGWAGVDWNDWRRIDAAHLSAVALDKCLRSRNPVAIEPGRYTAILEPQAVHDLFQFVVQDLDRFYAETGGGPFAGLRKGTTKLGQRVFDPRLTVTADPMDPDLGFPPFRRDGAVYHPAVWIEQGVLTNLAYEREYAIQTLRRNAGLPNSWAYRMSGGTATLDEMIATTERGLIVTRFSNLNVVDPDSLLLSGYTRDGLWLVEHGTISKPVKNLRFTESPMFVFNQIQQIGTPVRVFSPDAPAIVPPVKVLDFSFTALADAV